MMHDDAVWRACVHDMISMDELLPEDWTKVATAVPNASATVGTQERFRSVLADQIVPASVTDIVEHITSAMQLRHPLDEISPTYSEDRRYERRRDAELRSAVRRTVASGLSAPLHIEQRSARIEEWAGLLAGLSAIAFDKLAPPHIKACPLPRTNPAFAAALVCAMDDRDKDLPLRMIMGAQPAGDCANRVSQID